MNAASASTTLQRQARYAVDFPDLAELEFGLNQVLNGLGPVTIEHRETNPQASSTASDVVSCRLQDGRLIRLLCKYGGPPTHECYGYRGGVPYEALAYRSVLSQCAATTPQFYGTFEPACDQCWLVVEYVDRTIRITKSLVPGAMAAAARWAGQFHFAASKVLSREPLPPLRVQNADYYRGWVARTASFDRAHSYPWFNDLCLGFEQCIEWLLQAPVTVTHGEFYPNNILMQDDTIYPIDWESAAIAPGEIDLASLTERWPADTARQCEEAYCQARWPDGPPAEFSLRLGAARLYWAFRWLGWWSPESKKGQKCKLYFEQLHDVGTELGFI